MHTHYLSRNQKLNNYYPPSTQNQKSNSRCNKLFKLLSFKSLAPSLKAQRILTLRSIAPEPSSPFQAATKLFKSYFH